MLSRLAALLCLLAAPAAAEPWTVQLDRSPGRAVAYDGDTLYVLVPELPGKLRQVSVRVLGIDTPEIRGRCEAERRLAVEARDYLVSLFEGADLVVLDVDGWDKYGGRIDARVITPDGRDLAALLVAAGLARPYDGGKRQGWCD